ncbi:elongation factor 1-beta [Candidatus Woesearchaeota archaeon]|nr:MAG: elongation factor 1-beta [Candidatus Woesearchaeota archaeon]
MGANAIITFKIMPDGTDVDVEALAAKCQAIATEAGAKGDTIVEINPVAFGLKEIKVLAMYEMGDDSFDPIAEKMDELEEVSSAEIYKMDLAMG